MIDKPTNPIARDYLKYKIKRQTGANEGKEEDEEVANPLRPSLLEATTDALTLEQQGNRGVPVRARAKAKVYECKKLSHHIRKLVLAQEAPGVQKEAPGVKNKRWYRRRCRKQTGEAVSIGQLVQICQPP